MRAPLTLIDDFPRRPDDQPTAIDGAGYRHPRWFWLGYFAFGVAFWTGVGFGVRALLATH